MEVLAAVGRPRTVAAQGLRRGSGTAGVLRGPSSTAMCQLAPAGFSEVDQNRGERPPSRRPVPTFCRKPVLPVLRAWSRLPLLRVRPFRPQSAWLPRQQQ